MTWEATAQQAGQLCTELQFRLLGARSPGITRELARFHLIRAHQIWPLLCARMGELAEQTPNCAQEGSDNAALLRDFVEARQQA